MQAETTTALDLPEPPSVRREKERRASSRARILERLQKGPANNVELNEICYRFGARILELRQQGYNIVTTPIGRGLFNYHIAAKLVEMPATAI